MVVKLGFCDILDIEYRRGIAEGSSSGPVLFNLAMAVAVR